MHSLAQKLECYDCGAGPFPPAEPHQLLNLYFWAALGTLPEVFKKFCLANVYLER